MKERKIALCLILLLLVCHGIMGEEVIKPEEKLTLERCKEIALINNPEISALKYEREAAQARLDFTFGTTLPNLRLVGTYNYYTDDQRLLPARFNGESGVFSQEIVT